MGIGIKESTEEHKRLKATDIVNVLTDLKTRWGKERKLAVFWDNASIHKARVVKSKAQELDIELIFNLPYHSELMGITYLWVQAKNNYK